MPVSKVGRNGEEEIWSLKTFFTTEETFPTVLRRSEVVDIQTEEISPLEDAIIAVEQKTKELSSLNLKYTTLAKSGQQINTNLLSRALDTVVDAPSGTGIPSYRQQFLTPEFIAQNPKHADAVQKLRDAIDDQVRESRFASFT